MSDREEYDPGLVDEKTLHTGRGPRVIIQWSDSSLGFSTVLLKVDQTGNVYTWGDRVPDGFLMIYPRNGGHQLIRLADVARFDFTDDSEASDAPA